MSCIVPQQLLRKSTDNTFASPAQHDGTSLMSLASFPDYKCSDAGINYQRVKVGMKAKGNSDLAERLLYEGTKLDPSDHMYWKGEDVQPFQLNLETSRFCRSNITLRSNEVVRLNRVVFDACPKILLRQTSDTLIAAIDRQGVWFGRSLITILKRDGPHSLEYLLAILNSAYMRMLYADLTHETGRVFAQVKLSKLNQLPIRVIDFSKPKERDLHDSLTTLVRMIEVQAEELKILPTGQMRTVKSRQLESSLRRMDEEVYILYNVAGADRERAEAAHR